MPKENTPKLVCFSCKFGWGYLNRNGCEKKVKSLIPVTCSGKLDTITIIRAFQAGADGVIILGCPEGECHFQDGNYQARNRVLLLQRLLGEFGIEPGRLKIKMGLDPMGDTIPDIIDEMSAELIHLGPLSMQAGNPVKADPEGEAKLRRSEAIS
jgi:F420-non-reducing hydrogenase iron-sulfur subunit